MSQPPPVQMVAILRGLTPARAPETGAALVAAGFRTIEVPLNSPEPFGSIGLLARAHPDCLVGAGTVLSTAEVDRVHAAGGRLVVAPNCDPEVIQRALELHMRVMPGIATATEAFAAVGAGATELKLSRVHLWRGPPARAQVLLRNTCVCFLSSRSHTDITELGIVGADG